MTNVFCFLLLSKSFKDVHFSLTACLKFKAIYKYAKRLRICFLPLSYINLKGKNKMQKKTFTSIFNQSIQFLSDDWKSKYTDILYEEHWSIITERIFSFAFENNIYHNPLPVFNEEIIADFSIHYQHFETLKLLKDKDEKAHFVAQTIEKTPFESLLVILGQRKTTASITDENGIPPLSEELLKSCLEAHNDQICKAARAREKHISRNSDDTFWGEIKGSPAEKEEAAKALVKKIIKEKTWWNVFTHYKHGVVFEIRVASGQGIRWKKNELELIGFLELFI